MKDLKEKVPLIIQGSHPRPGKLTLLYCGYNIKVAGLDDKSPSLSSFLQ
jgi:hypothetical protein